MVKRQYLHRIEAVKAIMTEVTDEVVIASNGMISREVFLVKDRPKNLYVMGSMGNALSIGIGIALCSDHRVIVISGDGAALMSLGTSVLLKWASREKHIDLIHYILDNQSHATTGGQPTCSKYASFESVGNTRKVSIGKGKGNSPRIPMSPEDILRRFMDAVAYCPQSRHQAIRPGIR